jgi:LacI family transcriptional regulator
MRKKRVTIEDVARAAGVHASTVSRALSPSKRALVTGAVAARVSATARRLGYSHDQAAAGLRTRRSATVGVLIPDIANPVVPPILRGIEAALAEAGYTAIIANTDNDALRAGDALTRLAARRVDGVILATVSRRDPLLERCRELGLAVVLVNRSVDDAATSTVISDDQSGAALAVRHLAMLGHRAIGHVAGPRRFSTGAGRRSGFVAALRTVTGRTQPPPIVEAASYEIEAGTRAAGVLLTAHPRITAIVAANDLLALGCYDAANRRGLACPRDISITGFNDMPFADRFDPPLTTIHIPLRAMGAEAARLLLVEIEYPRAAKREIKLQPELVVRGSTAPPRPSAARSR